MSPLPDQGFEQLLIGDFSLIVAVHAELEGDRWYLRGFGVRFLLLALLGRRVAPVGCRVRRSFRRDGFAADMAILKKLDNQVVSLTDFPEAFSLLIADIL